MFGCKKDAIPRFGDGAFCVYLAFFFAADSDDPHLVAKGMVFSNLFASVAADDRVDMAAFSNELVDLLFYLGKSAFKLLGKLHTLSSSPKVNLILTLKKQE